MKETHLSENVTPLFGREHVPQPAGEPIITFGMDDDRITFRDEDALREYVAGAVADWLSATDPVGKGAREWRSYLAQAWDEGYERAALDRYEALFDPGGKSLNPYRSSPIRGEKSGSEER